MCLLTTNNHAPCNTTGKKRGIGLGSVGLAVGVRVGSAVAVVVGVSVREAVADAVGVDVDDGTVVSVGVSVLVGDGVTVGVGVAVGTAPGMTLTSAPGCSWPAASRLTTR